MDRPADARPGQAGAVQGVETASAPATASLEWKPIKDITGDFFVPKYQRGYRWTPHEVTQLLGDIKENGDQPYSLQPVVVKQMPNGWWELVDGQQRLTTLYLVLRYLEREGLKSDGPRYTISYETRPGSSAFLRDPDLARSDDNIDFFHIYRAYDCIRKWFDANQQDRQLVADDMYRFLLRQVRVIWYVAPPLLDSSDLFIRLNVGRIPLTDAELVKASLITQLRSDRVHQARQLEVALAWDRIEQDLGDPNVWAFVCGDSPDDRPTKMTLLLDTLAGGHEGEVRPPYMTFERLHREIGESSERALALWGKVQDLHGMLMGWFAEPRIFHAVGYLVTTGIPFAAIVGKADGCTKSEFAALLREMIRDRLALSASKIRELSYESDSGRMAMQRLLLLMNVEAVALRGSALERYPFARHAEGKWSLEHIHAQNSEGLARAEQWEAWRAQHLAALEGLPSALRSDEWRTLVEKLRAAAGKLDRKTYSQLALEVDTFFTVGDMENREPEFGVHGVANMALLDRDDNASLNNSAFEVKRRRIIEMDRQGRFLPPCTRQVFLKYYSSGEGLQVHLWGPDDRKSYLAALLQVVKPYLQEEGVEA